MADLQPVSGDDLLVGDDERRAVDARLHEAVGQGRLTLVEYEQRAGAVWAARTRGELSAVTRDLPTAAPARTSRVPARSGRRTRRWALLGGVAALAASVLLTHDAVAFWSGQQATVRPGEEVDVVSVMGGTEVLVRGVAGEVDVDARVLMGGVTVVVPDHATVEVGGLVVMGGTSCSPRVCDPDRVPQLVVDVDAAGAMGGVSVITESERDEVLRLDLVEERLDELDVDED